MLMTCRERFLAAVHGEAVDRIPVFPLLMFLAVDRARISYRTFATDGHALAEAQLQMQQRFAVDAITACSDAFRLSADLGGEMAYPEDKPPYLLHPLLTCAADLQRLRPPDPYAPQGRMYDRISAIAEMARQVGGEVAVLGWVDMPFAEACALCGVTQFMLLLMDEPEEAHRILRFLTALVIDFALAQAAAGAVMIGAGDAAASLLSLDMYREFALPYEQEVCMAVHAANNLVKLHICGETAHLLDAMVLSGADLFNVDHLVPFSLAKAVYGGAGKCFKGNLDPVADIMQSTPEACAAAARRCIHDAEGAPYMLSAGCEIPAETPDEVFEAFCRAAQG